MILEIQFWAYSFSLLISCSLLRRIWKAYPACLDRQSLYLFWIFMLKRGVVSIFPWDNIQCLTMCDFLEKLATHQRVLRNICQWSACFSNININRPRSVLQPLQFPDLDPSFSMLGGLHFTAWLIHFTPGFTVLQLSVLLVTMDAFAAVSTTGLAICQVGGEIPAKLCPYSLSIANAKPSHFHQLLFILFHTFLQDSFLCTFDKSFLAGMP